MAKTVDSTPLIVTIAEKLGTAVGTIVAKTTDVVEGATKSLQSPRPSPKSRAKKWLEAAEPQHLNVNLVQ